MLDLTEWLQRTDYSAKPWLLLGKGPTFDRRAEFDLSAFYLFGLNHVPLAQPVEVAHAIDVDVVGDCGDALVERCRWLLIPRYPNLHSEKSLRPIEEWFADYPVLAELDRLGRLVCYNLAGRPRADQSPVITSKYFSSEAALKIIGHTGASTVRTLGIDGGRGYAASFSGVAESTHLANGAASFDDQFERLRVVAEEYDIDFAPLIEPFRIFIGSDPSQIVAQRVLEYSIRKNATIPVDIIPMFDIDCPVPTTPQKQGTKFSYYRWMIPELCGYRGRALYLDPDMLVFADVKELAEFDFGGKAVLAAAPEPPDDWKAPGSHYFSVRNVGLLLLDCGQLDWKIGDVVDRLDRGEFTYEQLFGAVCIVDPDRIADTIPPTWNDLERYSPDTRLTHFTIVPKQPWKTDGNPLSDLWMSWYREAVEAGAVPPEEVETAIALKQVKPSLRAALRYAPTRRAVVTNASRDLDSARLRIAELERELQLLRRSWAYRLSHGLVESARGPREKAIEMSRRLRRRPR